MSIFKMMKFVTMLAFLTASVNAQGKVLDNLKELDETNGKMYIQPLVNGVGMNMSSGFFHSAKTHSVLGFEFGVVAMVAMAPNKDKEYTPVVPGYTPVPAPTVIGDKDRGANYGGTVIPPGVGINSIPFVAPQLVVGVPFKTDVIVRFMPKVKAGDMGKVSMLGFGVKHNLNQWIPVPLPLDIAAGFTYQSVDVGSYLSANASSYHLIASKSLLLFNFYGGFAVESSSMDIKYDQNGGAQVKFSADGVNKSRIYGGVSINLLLMYLNADIDLGKYKAANVGVGFKIR
ncbi:hypothetical protein F9K33_04820 [bacterium]|nr:MAG: hypothetical protein F9K33_04820 [bacterium]